MLAHGHFNITILVATLLTALSLTTNTYANQPTSPKRQPSPRDVQICIRMIEHGDYQKARELARNLCKNHPDSAKAHLLLALSYHKARRYEPAEPIFEKAIKLDPKDITARVFYGWCLYNLAKPEKARQQFEAFLAVNQNYADAHFALGLLDYDAGDFQSSRKHLEKAIECATRADNKADQAKAHARIADIFIRQGQLQKAKSELDSAIRLNPNLYGAYFKLSGVLQRLGDTEGAKKAREMHAKIRDKVRPTKGHPE
jgi:Tfp pilus assembly protein PilF